MAGYNTEQKKIIIDFLSSHKDDFYTIEELIMCLHNEFGDVKTVPGRSTVYRLMTKLVNEGTVKRFVNGNSRHFYYQIMASTHCHDHIHMKCTKCGKLFHMDDSETEVLLYSVLKNTNFIVNKEETTLYGTCNGCNGDIK